MTTKPKRVRKRYETSQQILAEIEKRREKSRHYIRLSEVLDAEANTLRLHGSQASELVSIKRDSAKLYRTKARRIEDVQIPKLIRKLAEFNTQPLPGVLADRSVER